MGEGTIGRMPDPRFQDVFGAYVREMRLRLGLNQVQMAARIGINQGTLSAIEIGDTAPSCAVIDKVADALGISVAGLLEGMRHALATEIESPTEPSRRRGRPMKTVYQPKK